MVIDSLWQFFFSEFLVEWTSECFQGRELRLNWTGWKGLNEFVSWGEQTVEYGANVASPGQCAWSTWAYTMVRKLQAFWWEIFTPANPHLHLALLKWWIALSTFSCSCLVFLLDLFVHGLLESWCQELHVHNVRRLRLKLCREMNDSGRPVSSGWLRSTPVRALRVSRWSRLKT